MTATDPDPQTASIERDEQRAFEQLMARLSPEHREVLALRELEEMSYRDIASLTSLPIGTVMSRLARARGALKDLWLDQTQGEARVVR